MLTSNCACSRQPLKLAVEHLQALLGNLIRHHVVDRDLQVFEAGAVQPLDPLRGEQVAIGDDGGDGAVTANGANDFVEVGVEQRFAAADGDDAGAQAGQHFDPAQHLGGGHGIGDFVVLVAVGAGEIAAPHGDDVRQDGVVLGFDGPGYHARLAHAALVGAELAGDGSFVGTLPGSSLLCSVRILPSLTRSVGPHISLV